MLSEVDTIPDVSRLSKFSPMPETRDRLRILWVSHLIPFPPKGGVLMRSNYLATELANYHQVDLLALNQSTLLAAYYRSIQEGIDAARGALNKHFGHVQFFEFAHSSSESRKRALALKSLFSAMPYSVAWFKCRELADAIAAHLRGNRYNIVHFDTVGLAQFRSLVNNVPTVLDHHNVESHMMLRRARKEGNPLKKWYFFQEGRRLKQYERKMLPRFKGHITCSELDSERLHQLGSNLNVKAIPNSVRVDAHFRPSASKNGTKLLFVGGLDWYPNRDAVLHFCNQIWPRIATNKVDVEFNIVGKNPCREVLDHARQDARIKVHGFVDDINRFYQESDVFVCPIRDGGGTKLKVLDAMVHFLPVVGYAEACEGIDVLHGHHALVAKNAEDFAAGVIELLMDERRAGAMGEAAHQLILEKYEARKVGRALCDYYLDIANIP